MRKIFSLIVVILLWVFVPIQVVKAESSRDYIYYIIPPSSSVTINDLPVTNDSSDQGKMMFRKENQEIITIPAITKGFIILTKNFRIDVKPETTVTVGTDGISLLSGSVHVISLSNASGEQVFQMGKLQLSWQSADFLTFVSADQTQKIVKVIEGEVNIENPATKQIADLKGQQMTSSDADGKLLIPFPVEISSEGGWWSDQTFNYTFDKLPIADAGEDQRVLGNIPVVLDGSGSDFVTGDIFEWELIKGPNDNNGQPITGVAFNSTVIQKPLFTPVADGEYHFSLQITDESGHKSNTDEVVIYVGKRYLKPLAIFPDVPADHPNNLAITYLYKKNVMKGSEDPKTGKVLFRPDDTINRVEILKALFENKGQKIPTADELQSLTPDTLFLDVKVEHWFAPYVYLAKKMGIVKGNDGLYRPADKVLLVEALKMIVETNQISMELFLQNHSKPYPDAEADVWYSPYLFFAKAYNLIDVDDQGHINPAQPLTRAKFAEIVYRMANINLLEKRSFLDGVLKDSKTKKGIADGEIYVYNVIEDPSAGDSQNDGFVQKGDLYFKTTTKIDGTFSISLPIHTKYYIEALSGDNLSTTRVVTQLEENKPTSIELELATNQ